MRLVCSCCVRNKFRLVGLDRFRGYLSITSTIPKIIVIVGVITDVGHNEIITLGVNANMPVTTTCFSNEKTSLIR